MSKRKSKSDTKQISIFEYLQALSASQASQPGIMSTEGTFHITEQLRSAIRAGIKNSSLSIHQIAGEMSHILGETVTAEKIYSWTRQSDELNGHPRRYIPAEFLPAFCKVTGSNDALVIMGKIVGMFVLPGPEALRAEIQKLDEKIATAKAKKRERLIFLREMEK